MGKILGIGIGIVVLSLIWFLAILACLILSRNIGPDGAIAPTVIAAIVTLILVFFPREGPDIGVVDEKVNEILDTVFIPRTCLIVFMFLTLIGGLITYFLNHCTQQKIARPISFQRR